MEVLLVLIWVLITITIIVLLGIIYADKSVYWEFTEISDSELKKILLKSSLNPYSERNILSVWSGNVCFIAETGWISSKYYISGFDRNYRIPKRQNHFIERRIKFLKK